MKHLNFLSKSGSQSGSHRVVTLASTVGSPSVHRRGTMLKLISVLAIILTLSIGQMWGANATMAGGSDATYNSASGRKCGSNSAGGTMTVTIPANATVLSVYIVGWKGDNPTVSISRNSGTISSSLVSPTCDNGFSGSGSSFTLANAESTYLETFTLSSVNSQTTVTFSTSAGKKRFGVWGAKICYAPTSPTNTTIGSTTATLGWSDAKNVNNYEVYYSTSSTAPTASSSGTTTTSKSINLTSLTESTPYYWWVRAYDSYCKSAWVAGTSFTTTASGCANKVNITNSATTNVTNGSFTVDKTGEQNACSALSVTVTPTPATHYHVASVSATNPATTGTAGSAVDNGNGTYTITYSANAKGNTTISVTFDEDTKYTLNYHDGSGDGTKTNVYEGTNLISALGTPAASCDATSTAFQGWSTTEIVTKTNTPPTFVAANDVVNSTTAAATYYAVYAKNNTGSWSITSIDQLTSGSGYATYNGSHTASGTTYTSNQVMQNSGIQFQTNAGYMYNTTAMAYDITSIVIESSSTNWSVYTNSSAISSTPASGAIAISSSDNTRTFTVSSTGHKYFHIKGGASTPKATSITVNYGTYKDYITTCCTELGSINGSVSLNQKSATLSWDLTDAQNGGKDHINSWKVEYKLSSDDDWTVAESTLAKATLTKTISDLNCNTDYDFRVSANVQSGYCDIVKEWTSQKTTKFTITKSETGGGGITLSPTATSVCDGDVIDVTANTPDGSHEGTGTIKVIKTGVLPVEDVTSTVYNSGTGKLTMPAYNITISATYTEKSSPSVGVSVAALNFGTPKKDASVAAQTFNLTGSALTVGTLTLVAPSGYTVSPSSITIASAGNLSATEITVTPNTGTAGNFDGTISISGAGVSSTNIVALTMTVQATYTVNWYVNGTKVHEQTDVANTDYDAVPSDFSAFTDCEDLHFVGWKEGAIDGGSTTSAPSLANIGTKITANKDYYAVFAAGTPGSTNKLFEETFASCAGTGGNDDTWSGNIGTSTINTDVSGWTTENAGGASSCIKAGTGSKAGSATTPSFSITGNGKLCFRAGAFGSDNTTINLTATGATLGTSSVSPDASQWSSYEVDITGATGSVQISFTASAASNQRFFLDDVVITQTVAANWTKWYTTCPHAYIVALSPTEVENGSISFAKNASAITEIETTGENDVTVDVVTVPATGYELTGVALSGIAGASYNAGVITLPANTEGPLTATATFSKANYAVTYTAPSNGNYTIKVGDAAAVSTYTTAQHEQTITLAVASVTEGYQFIGWTVTKTVGGAAISVDGNNQFTMPAEAVTVAATFQEIPAVAYTVTFSQGEHGSLVCNTCTESSLEEESAGAGVTLPSCNAATGYAFLGWTATENKTSVDEGLTAGALYRPEDNITLYAVYKQLKAVTLMKRDNSGTDVVLYEDVATGKVALPARTCKNNDYSFAGWSQTYYSTEQEDADAVIFATGEYTPMGNITLYPVFSRGSESYAWTKITDLSTVTEGTYALVSTADYAFNGTMSSGHGQKTTTAFEFTDGVAEEAPEGTCILEFQAVTEEEVVVGYKMYNETNGYLYASAASSGKLAWHNEEESYWKEGSGDWIYNANTAHLRVYDNTFRTYSGSSNNALAMAKKTAVPHTLYLAAPANTVAAPTFTPAAGAYYGAQNVTISSETNDVTIYYTDNGSIPSNESTEFTGAFSVSSSKTIKAIAIDEDGYSSAVTEAAYTIYPVYNSIAAYQAASAQEAATARVLINKESANAIVIGVVGAYSYIQDGTAAMVIKRPNNENQWTVGSELDGYVQGTRSTYYGLPMITVADVTNVATSEGTLPTAQAVNNLDFAGAWSSYAGNLIKVSNVYFQAQATSSDKVALQDGSANSGQLYDAIHFLGSATLPLTATACDVTGILVARPENEVTTYYIAPTALTDISTKGAVAQLNVSPVGGADAEHAMGIAPGGQVTVTPVDGFATTLNSEEISTISTVDVTGPISITVSASRQFYADNNQTYYYDVDDSYMPVTVTQPANAGGSTIEANLTSAQEGNAITLNYNLADHYHFNAWNVYKTGDAETKVTVTNNQFNMPAYAVTVEANIEEDAYATVVFNGNGATGTAPASQKKYVGQEVTMPNKGALVKADHVLASWTYNATEYAIGGTYEIQAGDAAIGGKNITFTANWTPYPWANGGDWMLVTDAAEVAAGSYVIIAAAASNVAISTTQNNNNRAQQPISKSDNTLTYGETAPAIFEVRAGNIENTLAFYDVVNEGYIYAASSGSNHLKTETTLSDNSSWAVEINGDNEAALEAQGTNTRNTLRHNNGSSIFSCYGSSSSESPIALYKYYAPVPKVTYDKNTTDEVTNMPNPSVQRAENNKAVIAAGPSRTGYTFEGWKNGNTTYTVGEEYTFTEDITLYAQWEALPSFHVTYNTSGSQGTTPTDATNYYEGDEVTLASASGLSNAGYFFDQWVVTYVDGESEVQTVAVEDGKFTMPAFNVTVTATWARKSSDKWIKVTAISQLTTGKEYIIVNTDATYAVGAQNSNNRAAAAIEENNGILTISDAVAKFTLGIPDADKYTFQNGGKYLYASSNTKNYLNERAENSDDNSVWTISIDGEGAATVTASGTNSHNVMRYNPNNGSPIFSCYTSGSTTGTLVSIYYKAPKIEINDNESVNVSDAAGSDIVIHEGGVLTIDAAASIGDLTVENGGKVTLSNKLTVVGTFSIETTMAGGNSGQLEGATASNFEASEAYIDITLGAGGTNQQWHAFTVPFPVDVMNGIYDLDGNKLTNEVNYAIMDYHGDIRAQGQYGWKKNRGVLVPGTFYIMATDGHRTTYRFKKTANGALVAGNSKTIYEYASSTGGNDNGWNGIGNPNLFYGKVNLAVQVLDPNSYTFITKTAQSTNFVVGTPFFYQATANGTMVMETANAGGNYAPARERAMEIKDVPVGFGNENFTDYLYVTANEDALNEYETGKDLAKMTMTNTPKVAQIFGKAYNTKLSMVNVPMVNDQAEVALELYAPQAGTYTISVPTEREDASLYLTKDGNIIWDLTMSPYEAEFDKGATEGYGLMLVRKAPQVTTGVETIDNSQFTIHNCQKVILNDHVYILREGQLYDVTGKAVK